MPDFRSHVRSHLPPLRVSGAREAEIIEELAVELEDRYEKELRGGAGPEQAWRSVTEKIDWPLLARDFAEILKEETPHSAAPERSSSLLSNVWNNVRFGFRILNRNPIFAAAAVFTIALGIGPNTAIYSILHAVFWAAGDNPKAAQQSILWSRHGNEQGFGPRGGIHVTPRDYLEWRRESTVFERMDAIVQQNVTLNDDADYPDRIQIQSYTPGAITHFYGLSMVLGRDFLPEEGESGKDSAVVLSNQFWQRRYKSDPSVLGRQIRLNGRPHRIVGVLHPSRWDRRREPLWTSLAVSPEQPGQDQHGLTVLGLRKPGVTIAQAQAEMDAIAGRLASKYPTTNSGWTVRVDVARNSWLNERTSANLWMLMAAVSLVLVIACLNVANLLLARGSTRLKEIAIRVSMGASKRQIFTQLMTESIVLSTLGGLAGIVLSWFLLQTFLKLAPEYWVPPPVEIHLNGQALLFTLTTTVLAGLVFGCGPAWQLAGLGISESLRSGGGRSGVGPGRHFLGRGLVIVEVALALTLLSAAAMVLQSYSTRMHADIGVQTANVLTFELPVRPGRLKTPAEVAEYNRVLKERIEAVPGVASVAAMYGLPLRDTNSSLISVARRAPSDPSQYPRIQSRIAGPGFFETLHASVVRGRAVGIEDTPASMRVAMVNEAFVKRYLDGLDPLVEELQYATSPGAPPGKLRIVGIYKNIANGELFGAEARPEVIWPLTQLAIPFTTFAVRAAVDPALLARPIAAAIHEFDSEMPMARVRTMEQIVEDATAFDRFELALYGGFGALALMLAVVGIYGLMAFVVSQRSAEMGMRIALGADAPSVFRLVLVDGLKLAIAGLTLGTAGAYFGMRALSASLYGTRAAEPVVLAGMGALLLCAGICACVIPAWRASVVDPVRILRDA